jgi:hypothetical protein
MSRPQPRVVGRIRLKTKPGQGPALCDLDAQSNITMRVTAPVVATLLADRDASVLVGAIVRLTKVFDHKGPVRLPAPVFAKVVGARREEGDDFLDTVYDIHLPEPVRGYTTGWKAYGRSYVVEPSCATSLLPVRPDKTS